MRSLSALVLVLSVCALQAQAPYQPAPPAIRKVLDAPLPPGLNLAPDGKHALLVEMRRYPLVKELARPMLRLAGARIDPRTNGPHNPPQMKSLAVMDLGAGTRKNIPIPAGVGFGPARWSPDGRRFVLAGTTAKSVDLWVGEAATGLLKRVPGVRLNAAFGDPLDWMGSSMLLVKAVPAKLGPPPLPPEAPVGPRIQEHDPAKGKASGMATFQDLLQNAADEALFAHFAQAQLLRVDLGTFQVQPIGAPGILASVSPAPDGKHILIGRLHKPFSYLVTADRFPQRFEVWNLQGKVLHTLADLPLAEDIPLEGVRKGPRGIAWVPTAPATLQWTEALDEGNPKRKVPHRDRLMTLAAPFQEGREIARTEHRLGRASWTEDGKHLLLTENDREKRWTRTWVMPAGGGAARKLWDMSSLDRYKNPGLPLQRALASGHAALRVDGGALWLSGQGATPAGNRPFLDRLDLGDFQSSHVFRSPENALEQFVGLRPDGSYLTRRETPTEAPNYVLHPADKGEAVQITQIQDPTPELRKIQKRLVKYKRPDGVDLSFTLYLPPDYKEGERRPALVWAYPMEFTDPATAGQVTSSPNAFSTPAGISHLFMLLKGYVILDDATMPVVGSPETVNNTFIEQVVASAKAAIDKADELGVIDPSRVAVGGHSYGAFMTANLLAHADLFKCGIARSGAYNRTLTPFGFQSERRTLWEAPETYLKVSPFMKANRFSAPVLLIHGEADNNSGTFPIQSERLFQALKGNNQAVRYVTLPHESHGYTGRESVEHTLWEMGEWLDRHLKGK
jgi:dipeptidyl aminopeptidase/acylaminoacyl peptidase